MNGSTGKASIARPPIFTRDFVLICLATFFSSGAQFLVLTAIPSLLTDLGYSSGFVGGFVGAFGLGALIVRLPVGQGVDRYGPRVFALVGASSMSAAYVLYAILSMSLTRPSLGSAVLFLLPVAGLAHSLGFSTYGTAAHSLVAYSAPRTRRGEAISYYGMLIDAARALGSGLSLIIVLSRGYPALLLSAAVFASLAAMLASNLRRAGASVAVPVVPAKASRIESRVLAPALTSSTIALSGGATLAFVPLLGFERGISNPGLFFTVISLTSILIRIFAGRLIDRFGRVASIIPAMFLAAAGLLLIARMSSIATLVLAGLVFGVGFSTASIALQARAVDMGGPERQGAAMATYFAMVDLGVGLGSITAGQFVPLVGYGGVFSLASAVPVVGLLAFLLHAWRHHARAIPPEPSEGQPGRARADIDLERIQDCADGSAGEGSGSAPGSSKTRDEELPSGEAAGVVRPNHQALGFSGVVPANGQPHHQHAYGSGSNVYGVGG